MIGVCKTSCLHGVTLQCRLLYLWIVTDLAALSGLISIIMKLILRLLVTAAVAFILAQILPGIDVDTYGTAIWFAIVLGLLNIFLKPLLILLTLPLTLVTFGLFLLVINTIVVLVASDWVKGFKIHSFVDGLLFSLVLTLITSYLSRQERRQQKDKQ